MYETLPMGIVPTLILFVAGGGLGVCHWLLVSKGAFGKSAVNASLVGQSTSAIDRYEEWKRF